VCSSDLELTSGECIIAFDPLGCGNGESVLITTGSVAAAWFGEEKVGIDAVIIGSLDE
jgi:ethanolamine utilization protein EutN